MMTYHYALVVTRKQRMGIANLVLNKGIEKGNISPYNRIPESKHYKMYIILKRNSIPVYIFLTLHLITMPRIFYMLFLIET